MREPVKPQLAEYGLGQEQYARYRASAGFAFRGGRSDRASQGRLDGHGRSLSFLLSLLTQISETLVPLVLRAMQFVQSMKDPIFKRILEYDRALLAYESSMKSYESFLVAEEENRWRSMSPHEFEAELAKLFKAVGFDVSWASASSGANLVLKGGGDCVAVICEKDGRGFAPASLASVAASAQTLKANKVILASVNDVSAEMQSLISGKPIRVMSLQKIIALKSQVQAEAKPRLSVVRPSM